MSVRGFARDSLIRKDYPTTGVLRLFCPFGWCGVYLLYQEGLPDYWGIETCLSRSERRQFREYQEGLPDYWGIETGTLPYFKYICAMIRKDYPTTGVLRLFQVEN